MRRIYSLPALAIAAGAALAVAYSHTARSADHMDGLTEAVDPAVDIADVFAWMKPATGDAGTSTTAVFAMTVYPGATTTTQFSDAVQYVIHTGSSAFNPTALPSSTVDIVATFDSSTPQNISLFLGTPGSAAIEYVTGNASGTSGLKSADGKVTVFAGPRADPFFFNLDGFHQTQSLVEHAVYDAGAVGFNDAGCSLIPKADQTAIVNTLGHDSLNVDGGGAPLNHFAALNELAIVVEVDTSLITAGGSSVAVWGATYK